MIVNDLKNIMFNLTGVPPKNQKIIFKAKVLPNDMNLGTANITANSKITLMGSK